MLTVLSPPVFPEYSDPVVRHQPRQDLFWGIAEIEITVLAVFRILGARHDGTVALTCHDDGSYRNGQGLLVPFVPKVRQRIDMMGLSWFLE